MSSHPTAYASARSRRKGNSDAVLATVLTMLATCIAAYDFLLLALHAQG